MKEVPGSPAFLIGHTFLCLSDSDVIACMEPRLRGENTHDISEWPSEVFTW